MNLRMWSTKRSEKINIKARWFYLQEWVRMRSSTRGWDQGEHWGSWEKGGRRESQDPKIRPSEDWRTFMDLVAHTLLDDVPRFKDAFPSRRGCVGGVGLKKGRRSKVFRLRTCTHRQLALVYTYNQAWKQCFYCYTTLVESQNHYGREVGRWIART